MPISFNEFPNGLRVPIIAMEFDNTGAITTAQDQPYNALLIGGMLAGGEAEPGSLVRITNLNTAAKKFGAGSMLYDMCAAYLANDSKTPLTCLAVPDDESGVAATAKIAFVGEASEAGTLTAYLSGKRFQTKVSVGMTATQLATSVAAKINGGTGFVATATAENGTVTLTANNKGLCGNDIDVRINYYADEKLPAGISAEITPFAGGTGNPDLMEYLGIIKDKWYNGIACGYTDLNNIMNLKEEMEDRWGPMASIEGWIFATIRPKNLSDLFSQGEAQNSPHLLMTHCYGSPSAPWAWSAALAGIAMYYGNIDPARPFQTLEIDGVLAPADKDRFVRDERNQILLSGIASWYVNADGSCIVERLVTTYKYTNNGASDTSYLDLNTGLTLGYIRWDLVNYLLRKFPRCKLANDGTRYGLGQAIVTPLTMKAEILNRFVDWEAKGLVESFNDFKDSLIVERNISDPNRLDVLMKPDLVNQFRIGAILNQFVLHTSTVETV